MIGRVRDRQTFVALGDGAASARTRHLRVRALLGAPGAGGNAYGVGSPGVNRVAFAIGKPVGNAVTRNRTRRRLRAAIVELERARPELFGASAYLVSARPNVVDQTFSQLSDEVEALFEGLGPALAGRPSADLRASGAQR